MKAKLLSVGLVLALAGAAAADVKPGDRKKGPDAQGSGKDQQQQGEPKKNPLPEIVEMMKQVEKKIAETDTARWTQDEQQKIAKALEQEGDAVGALRKLIDEVESSAQQQQGGGSSEQQKQQRQRQQQQGQKQQPKERSQDGQQKPVDPAQREKAEREKREREKRDQSQKPPENDKKAEVEKQPDALGPLKTGPAAPGEKWGDLPPKASREASDASKREMPVQWRKQLEDYFRRLADPKK